MKGKGLKILRMNAVFNKEITFQTLDRHCLTSRAAYTTVQALSVACPSPPPGPSEAILEESRGPHPP